jgi:hypothetical protein
VRLSRTWSAFLDQKPFDSGRIFPVCLLPLSLQISITSPRLEVSGTGYELTTDPARSEAANHEVLILVQCRYRKTINKSAALYAANVNRARMGSKEHTHACASS